MGCHDDGSELEASLAAVGMKLEEAPDRSIELWPDMLQAVEIFSAMSSQWNVGTGGLIGLRYEALPLILDAHAVAPEKRKDLLSDIRTMERAAVEAMRDG